MLFDDLPQTKNDAMPIEQQKPATVKNQTQDLPADDQSNISDGKKSKSLVDSLGKTGTTMAFMPAALRKRKAPGATARPRKQATNSVQHDVSTLPNPKPNCAKSEITTNSCERGSEEKDQSLRQEHKKNINIHEIPLSFEHIQDEYKEPQHLIDLHAAVRSADMYNPMMPNDYLAYRQSKENKLINANLQKQAEKTLEMQQKLRDQIEDERQKAIASGDVSKIIESRLKNATEGAASGGMGRGRGRGRGLNNLPAWLVKKQQEQQLMPK